METDDERPPEPSSGAQDSVRLLNEHDLAARWKLSVKTLRNARVSGANLVIPFVKIGRSVRYRLSDIEGFEAANTRKSTSDCGSR
ncbi:helix-turn-helix domain-containing protein [Mesorhizobium australicum]|uniref:Helix-turn-helix domain-containing protein n=1 Tax=Mesorhizobium australicum TaxID=536018 RepID=A0ACC6T2Q9_9HYPH